MKKFNLKVLIFLAIFIFLLSGCTPASTGIDLSDVAEQGRLEEEQRISDLKLTEKEKLDKDYADGLYFEDFSVEKEMINQEFYEFIKDDMDKLIIQDYFYHVDAQLYNSTYQKVRDEGLTFDEIFAGGQEYIKKLDVEVYNFIVNDDMSLMSFLTQLELKEYSEPLEIFMEKLLNNGSYLGKLTIRVIDKKSLDQFDIEDYKSLTSEELLIKINLDKSFVGFISIDKNYDGTYGDKYLKRAGYYLEDELNSINTRYNQEFIYVGNTQSLDTNRPRSYSYVTYAPKNDLSLIFAGSEKSDRYLHAFIQKLVTEKVNAIIDDVGLTNELVQFNVVVGNESSDRKVDLINFDDYQRLIRTIDHRINLSLYYLKSPNKEIDYDKLLRVEKLIREYFGSKQRKSIYCFTFYYEIEDDYKPILSDLFRKEYSQLNFYYDDDYGFDLDRSVFKTRAHTEGFKLLDVYGKKLKFMNKDNAGVEESKTVEEFIEEQEIIINQ